MTSTSRTASSDEPRPRASNDCWRAFSPRRRATPRASSADSLSSTSSTRRFAHRPPDDRRLAVLPRGAALLGAARLREFRRARGSDRDDAPRPRGAAAVDLGGALSPCPELLHAPARTRGAAARDL